MEKRVTQCLVLALAVLLTALTGLPVASAPIKVYDSMAAMMLFLAPLAAAASWGYLAVSGRRRRDYLISFGLNLLTVIFLCRALNDIGACYEFYLHGGG